MYLYALDLVGVFAFAAYGAHAGSRHKLDLFGILVCSFLTALGGGTIREALLGSQPAYFHNYTYVFVVLAGMLFTVLLESYFHKIHRYMLVLDAIGLAAFAYIGAARAESAGLGLVPMIFFAVLTAAGGGILTDIICNRKPLILRGDFYATPAMLLAVGYFLLGPSANQAAAGGTLLLCAFGMRMIFVYRRYWWRARLTLACMTLVFSDYLRG
jgi:uncharacterized membrane protein YeiH